MKLVDLLASKASAFGRVGSSPTLRTKKYVDYGKTTQRPNKGTMV